MPTHQPQRTMLVLSQVYLPDPAAVGQQLADAASEMVRRGWRVIVLASARAYSNPSIKYPSRQLLDGVEVVRLPLSSFGKKGLLVRALAAALFLGQTVLRGLLMRRFDAVLVSTSPPMSVVAALLIHCFRRTSIKFWVMDINPDQLVALGVIRPGSLPARVMDWFNAMLLRRADQVIVLDRFMAETMSRKADVRHRTTILPPWSHEEHVEPVAHEHNPFRTSHGLEGKFVFMYSGNHGLALPLETFLKAATTFKNDPRVVFMFIGDGKRKKEVEQTIQDHGLSNMFSLPYQPLSQLKYSLSAADVHLISIGDGMVGIIHPCKVYGAMAVARPILVVGPTPSHITDLLAAHRFGIHLCHGDVEGMIAAMHRFVQMDRQELAMMGQIARHLLTSQLSQKSLCGQLCDLLETQHAIT